MKRLLTGLALFALLLTGMSSAFAATDKLSELPETKKNSVYAEGTLIHGLIKAPDALSVRFSPNVRFGVAPSKKQQVAMKISF